MEYLQQLELECPFCSETQPSESARWDNEGVSYTAICQGCGKMFSGLSLVTAYNGNQNSPSSLISKPDGHEGDTPRS
jgi:uncharacterized Zn finger protein